MEHLQTVTQRTTCLTSEAIQGFLLTESDLFNDLFTARYELLARGPDAYDCYGLVLEVSKRLGIDLPENILYTHANDAQESFEAQRDNFILLTRPELYCLVAIEYIPGYITHVGIMITREKFLHMTRAHGVLLTSLNDLRWKTKLRGFYKWNSLNSR